MQILNLVNPRRLLWLPLLITSLAGCDDLSYIGRGDAAVVVKAADGTDPELTRKVLLQRFAEYRPSAFSTVEGITEQEGRVRFVFHRGTPDPRYWPTLIFQRGVLTATLETGELAYTNEDIVSAATLRDNGKVYLNLVVTDEAAKRIGELTANNIGKVINVVLDGFAIFNTTITETFSKEFKLSAEYPFEEVRVIEVLLKHGALPGRALIVSVEGEFGEPKAAESEPATPNESKTAEPVTPDESKAAEPAH
jgi:preprotein translocase subunit SecD